MFLSADTDRLERVLKVLRVLRFLNRDEKTLPSIVPSPWPLARPKGATRLTALPSPHGEGGAVGDG